MARVYRNDTGAVVVRKKLDAFLDRTTPGWHGGTPSMSKGKEHVEHLPGGGGCGDEEASSARRLSLVHVQEEDHGTVIAAEDSTANETLAEVGRQPLREQTVVEPPADVFGTRVGHVRPEGVGAGRVGTPPPERVDEAATVEERRESLTLLDGEAGVLLVAFRVGDVDLVVRHVHVAAHHHRLGGVQGGEEVAELDVPLHPLRQRHQLATRVGYVCVNRLIGYTHTQTKKKQSQSLVRLRVNKSLWTQIATKRSWKYYQKLFISKFRVESRCC